MSSTAIIKFENLTKYYGNHIGIEKLNFSIEAGCIFGFLGPNGSGKTTSIRLMLDLLKPSSGSVKIFGFEVKRESIKIRQRLGYLPGDFSPYDKMTGKEFLKFSMQLRRMNKDVPPYLFDLFELGPQDLSKKIREYSQGMKQKLGIIHAVAHDPELIILDEPSTGLDPLMQDSLYELILDLNKKGTSIFFSSHNLPEVEKICEKVAIVKEGKLVGFESLESLRKKINRKLKITLADSVDTAPVLPNASLLTNQHNTFEYLVHGSTNELTKELSLLDLEQIVFPEASLEDIFLSYYEKNERNHGE